MNSELLQGFRLGDAVVEPLTGQVTGASGSSHLPPKAVEVLLCLATRPGDLVSRDELLAEVWGPGNGSQEALGHAISEIRHAFDDHHDNPRLIQTLPKRGYRLLREPEYGEAGPADARDAVPTGRGWWSRLLRHGVIQAAAAYLVFGWLLIQVADTTFAKIGLPIWAEHFVTFMVIGGFPLVVIIAWFFEFVGGQVQEDRGEQSGGLLQGLERNYLAIVIAYAIAGLGAAVYQGTVGFAPEEPIPLVADDGELLPVESNSIAVLRLATFDDDPVTKAFSDGLSEDIIDGLARIPGLLVSSRGDSWSLPPNSASDIVRRRLRVASYIEGSVRFLDDDLKVVVQLIDSQSGFHLFSRSFEVDLGSTDEMQRTVTGLVVANLKLAVETDSLYASTRAPVAADRDAYLSFMLGREAMLRPISASNIGEAIAYFNEALDKDAGYPAAFAGLCNAHVSLYELRKDPSSIDAAEAACKSAQAVAPRLPVVLRSIGRLYAETGRPDEAERSFVAALTIDEQDAAAMRGLAQIRRGQKRYEEAVQLMRRSIELQPGNWNAINGLGNLYFRIGDFAGAAAEYRKVVFLNPDNHITLGNLASTSMMSGDFDGARDALLRATALEQNATHLANLGIAYYYLGDLDESIDTLRRAVDLVPNDEITLIALADALNAGGMPGAANEVYLQAGELAGERLRISGDNADAMTSLAWATAMTGDPDHALSLAQRAVELDPASPYTHYYKAIVASATGDAETAIDACEFALENGYPVAMLAAEPILGELQVDPRFVQLLAKYDRGGQQ